VATKVVALNALANIYDAAHLDDVTQMEATLRRQQPDAVEPYALLSARVQGVVIIEVVVNESGNVTQPKILRSIPLLDQAALDAVREWQFTPSMLNGKLVPVVMTTTVNFVLPPPAESAPPNR
jgi:protein TonB